MRISVFVDTLFSFLMWQKSAVGGGRFHSLDPNQCIGGLGRFLSKELWLRRFQITISTSEMRESKGVYATLKIIPGNFRKTLKISWKIIGILSIRNPEFEVVGTFCIMVVQVQEALG